ncbi:DUF397 domain-containing protein [Streptomyces griseoviridis]|uniref:DUF397 domain-containing protein n=1 Tax=Streptomyces griseoviridis TaxID=45398 RepID=UPI0027D84125|nr:DUF397 domain-containing protein [Streptomyces griseoviridis]
MKWVKSSHSDAEGGACAEVARSTVVRVRDSKQRTGPEAHVTAPAWAAFIAAVQPLPVPSGGQPGVRKAPGR